MLAWSPALECGEFDNVKLGGMNNKILGKNRI
jgi:hypothetical protein